MTLQKLEEMLLAMAYAGENTLEAENSFTIVYKEYSKFLTYVVRSRCEQMGIFDNELVHDIAENTFLKIYDAPLSFEIPNSAKDDRCFKGWLSKVARNELLRILKESTSGLKVVLETPEIEPAFDETEGVEDDLGINRSHLERALATLHERDRQIILALYSYHEEGKKTPSSVLENLCQLHGTTRENIRQIKRRCEQKITEYFTKHTSLKPVRNVGTK